MGRFIVRRFLWMIVVLFAISLITFVLMHQIPGGPFDKEKKLSKDVLANINTKYHLDDPLVVQYLSYMGQIIVPRIFQGDPSSSTQSDYLINVSLGGNTYYQWMNFGPSYKSTARSVNDIFRDQLPVSAELGLLSLALALIIGVPLGIIAALNRNTRFDYLAMSVAITGVSIPAIVLGPFLIWILAVTLKWLPVSGWNGPEYLIMPTFALGFASSALIARLTRAALLEVLHEDYVRTARAKGLSEGGDYGDGTAIRSTSGHFQFGGRSSLRLAGSTYSLQLTREL